MKIIIFRSFSFWGGWDRYFVHFIKFLGELKHLFWSTEINKYIGYQINDIYKTSPEELMKTIRGRNALFHHHVFC